MGVFTVKYHIVWYSKIQQKGIQAHIGYEIWSPRYELSHGKSLLFRLGGLSVLGEGFLTSVEIRVLWSLL